MIQSKIELTTQRLPRIGTDAFAVFFVILSHLYDKEQCWPGIERIRHLATVEVVKTGEIQPMPEKRCYAAIKRLIKEGMVERHQERLSNGDWGRRYFKPTEPYVEIYQSLGSRVLYELPSDGLVNNGQAINGEANNDQTEYTSIKGNLSIKGENEKIEKWLQGGDERITAAREQLLAHFKDFPPSAMLNLHMIKMTSEEFYEQLEQWLRYNRDVAPIIQNPTRFLTGGRGSFISWLKKPWNQSQQPSKGGKKSGDQPQGGTYTTRIKDIPKH